MPLVSVRGLKRSFHKDGATVSVLKGIDFEVREGEFVTIMGPSGAGKTTFLHIIGSLDRPTEGRGILQGKGHQPLHRGGAVPVQERKGGIRLPVLPPPAGFHRPRKYHDPPLDQARQRRRRRKARRKNSCGSWVWPIEGITSRVSCQEASSRGWLSQGRSSTGPS